jgi:acyl-homoserine-lactone acylase
VAPNPPIGKISGMPNCRMLCTIAAVLATSLALDAQPRPTAAAADLARWRATAARVTIYRDSYGVAHVYGQKDADAVFGMVYAQAEDDFRRIERNYLVALGRLAEVDGEAELLRDLRQRLWVDDADLRARHATSPLWLKQLMQGWADGLNFYLQTHPAVTPRGITRYEPWMALSFSEGSIGGDIESVGLRGLGDFYRGTWPGATSGSRGGDGAADDGASDDGAANESTLQMPPEPAGSNGFAIAPKNTVSGHALLMINPHTSFYFRPEIHMASAEGLDAYGAVTWGQFFIYQGFNNRLGWMHTSGGGDVRDEYRETIVPCRVGTCYRVGQEVRPLKERTIVLRVKRGEALETRSVTAFYTHRGPIVRRADNGGDTAWVSVRIMYEPVAALTQSYTRTKAKTWPQFLQAMQWRTNSSNNTVYADADGNTALFYGNFVPKRDPSFDYRSILDGTNPKVDWQGLHGINDLIRVHNPPSGWIQNTNNWPFSASGPDSPKQSDYPAYMWSDSENPRGWHAVKVLQGKRDFTLDGLIAAANDAELTAFEPMLPGLLQAYDALDATDTLRAALAEPVVMLRAWDRRFDLGSVATSVAIYWGQDMLPRASARARAAGRDVYEYIGTGVPPRERLEALARAVNKLTRDFGTWRTPWGEINRFQRLTGDLAQPYDDAKPSLAVPFASATWGSLASFGQRGAGGATKRIYGDYGNSFVAAVEFGPKVRAKSVLAGGVSGDPASPYFMNQAEAYAAGRFKDVAFYRADVEKAAVRRYSPGSAAPNR